MKANLTNAGWAAKLKALRRKFRISQAELARQLEVTERSIRRWEKKAVTPSRLARLRLRAIYGEEWLKLFNEEVPV